MASHLGLKSIREKIFLTLVQVCFVQLPPNLFFHPKVNFITANLIDYFVANISIQSSFYASLVYP